MTASSSIWLGRPSLRLTEPHPFGACRESPTHLPSQPEFGYSPSYRAQTQRCAARVGGRACGCALGRPCLAHALAAISARLSAGASEQSFRHEALLYDGEDQFVAGV